jgi:hypothetical protein
MIWWRPSARLTVGALLLMLAACEDPLSFRNRERLVVMPAEREIMVGDTMWIEATVYDRRGRVQPGVEIRWSRSGDVLNQTSRAEPDFVWSRPQKALR